MSLLTRWRAWHANITRIYPHAAIMAAVAQTVRAYVEPDSLWRLNLIKEIADHINDDNAIALAAIEGSVLDLGQRMAAVRAELDQLRRGA